MKYSKDVKDIARGIIDHGGYYDRASVSELLVCVSMDISSDFTVDYEGREYRVIFTDDILDTLVEELASDEYMLGCFNANFLGSTLGIDPETIEVLQKAEAFEGVGKLVIGMGKLEEVAEDYINTDGAGHHFSHYDGNETNAGNYTVFCTN